MAYIGQSIKNGTFSVLDTSGNTYNGSNTTFNLGTQVGSPAQLLVSHDGVIQKPGTDYTLATGGTQITFTTAPASGASIFIIEISGAVGGPMNRDINGDELILDVDGDTSITADTDDQIDVKIGGTDQFSIKDGVIEPTTDNDVDIGSTSKEFKDGYFDGTLHCDVLDLAGTEYTSIGQGKIAQVVTATNTNSTASSSTSFVETVNTVAITPSATNSKIFVVTHFGAKNPQHNQSYFTLYRDVSGGSATNLGDSTYGLVGSKYAGGETKEVMGMSFLDSPSTTSAVEYKVYVKSVNASTVTMNPDSKWSITAMEVLA